MLRSMGLDLTLFMADWARLGAFPVGEQADALGDAVRPPAEDDLGWQRLVDGWNWPPGPESAWCAEYRFFGTTGSARFHSDAGRGWADMRPLVDPSVRADLDVFLGGLLWGADEARDPALGGGDGVFPPVPGGRSGVLLVSPPGAVAERAAAWGRVGSRLEALRGAFAAECVGWACRPQVFEEFTALLGEWGGVTAEAARRGWGLVGLA
ncbi:hypothetical protein Slala02_48830 [Streptomyces lavendulae subsp. lavendulae]|nr:hypothetical protein Slala01_52900 [Streptomyces lavendulae subsp. lavendulae]GLX29063.1 hypothetical protein Slala02_48830 [Streptomyces lavendulae subsp. lavendulae]